MTRTTVIAISCAAVLGIVQPGMAHEHPCAHFHEPSNPDRLIYCTNDDAPCEDADSGAAGQCKEIQESNGGWCECVVPRGDDDGGCLALTNQFFSDQGDGSPTANTSIIYLAAPDVRNYTVVSEANNGGVDFAHPETGVSGTFTLFFGSFSNPTEVPVTVEDVSLSLPDIGGQGVAYFELPDGAFQSLVYDSTTGVISTVDSLGIQLWLDTDYGKDQPVRVYLEGRIEAGGLFGFAQGEAPLSIFGDDFDTGSTSDWSAVVGEVVALLTRLGVLPG